MTDILIWRTGLEFNLFPRQVLVGPGGGDPGGYILPVISGAAAVYLFPACIAKEKKAEQL
jgi:hypothetical protein